jgi:hypothetical protein
MRHPFFESGRAGWWLALAGVLALNAGCVSTQWFQKDDKKAPPPPGNPCRVATWWVPHLVQAPDTLHGGTPTPGLAGRLYLYGPDMGVPMVGIGGLLVCAYDETHVAEGAEPVQKKVWYIDPKSLHRCLKKDAIGWGYSLFLPWSEYCPAMSQVTLRILFEKPDGGRLFQDKDSHLNLSEDNGVVTAEQQSHPLMAPGAAPQQPPPTGAVPSPATKPPATVIPSGRAQPKRSSATVIPSGRAQPKRSSATVIPSGHAESGVIQSSYTSPAPPVLGGGASPPMLGAPARPLSGPNPNLPVR